MATIAEVRAQYPQYSDMSDTALADALHAKFYSDIPKPDFYAKVGLPPEQPSTAPDWAKEHPTLYRAAVTARDVLGPTLEVGGAVGGGVLGAPFGGVGALAGSAGGYAAARGVNKEIDKYLGLSPAEAPTEAALRGTKDLLMGATMEAGGQVAAPILAKGVGKIMDLGSGAKLRAADMLRKAFGETGWQGAADVLKAAPSDLTAAQAIAGINAPTAQAVLASGAARQPEFFAGRAAQQNEANLNALATTAGGGNQLEARAARGAAKNALRDQLVPDLQANMTRANYGGRMEPYFAGEAAANEAAATNAVQDVRRFVAAGERAPEVSKRIQQANLPGQPPISPRYTYTGELAKKADEVASQAAEGSLDFGQAAQFAKSAQDSLAERGLQPLRAEPIIDRLMTNLSDPKFAGNDEMRRSVGRLIDDIKQWTDAGGVIDAWALDSIRKNSVNAVVRDVFKGADPVAERKAAAAVMTQVKPLFVDAVEQAGGVGYGAYLKDWQAGEQAIARQKLSGEMMRLYEKSPQKFVDIVNGNDTKLLDKILGPKWGDNIEDAVGPQAYAAMRKAADTVTATQVAAQQAQAGQEAFRQLLGENVSKAKLPSLVSATMSFTNKAVGILENALNKSTMRAIGEAAKSGKNAYEIISMLPADQRNAALRALADSVGAGASVGAVVLDRQRRKNNLAPENKNNLLR